MHRRVQNKRKVKKMERRVDESDRLHKRLELMDAFIKKNFRAELYLAKQQKTLPMWKVIEADMSLQEHLADMEEKRLLWKQWNRGNQTEGRPCRDNHIPHVCICDQITVARKRPEPKPKPKPYSVKSRSNIKISPVKPELEDDKCCIRCCKSNPSPDPSPLTSREASFVMRIQTAQSNNETSKSMNNETTFPKIDNAKSDASESNASTLSSPLSGSKQSINRLGENQSTSSVTTVDIHSIPGQKSVETPPTYAESTRSESRVGPGIEFPSKEGETPIPSSKNSEFQNDYASNMGSSVSPHKAPSGTQARQLLGLTSFDVAVNTDISYIHKPVMESNKPSSKESSRRSPAKGKPFPSKTESTGAHQYTNKKSNMATMAQVYTLAQNTAKAVLARKKSNLEDLQTAVGVTSEQLDEMEKNGEKLQTKYGKREQSKKPGKSANQNKPQRESMKPKESENSGTISENADSSNKNGSDNQETGSGDPEIDNVDPEAANENQETEDGNKDTGDN